MVSKFKLETSNNFENKTAISRTLEIANSYAGELSIEVLPLSKIELDPENKRDLILTLHDAMNGIDKNDPDLERKKQEWKSLESLAKTIQDDQLINPIFVYRYGNNCRLIAGERRTLASAIAGKKEVIARIAGQRPVGTKLRILQWVENNERSDLTLAERVASLEAILQEYFSENKEKPNKEKITAKLLGDLTGISLTHARRYILIFNAQADIRKAIDDGKLENINLVELICAAKNADQRDQLLAAALSGMPINAVIKLKNELEAGQSRKLEKRGRKRINISLGSVKPSVVKVIMDALISSLHIKMNVNEQLKQISDNVQWENSESVTKAFKRITALIEAGV